MSKPKQASKYPTVYLDYVESLCENPAREIIRKFVNKKAANAFYLDFNGFKNAALSEDRITSTYRDLAAISMRRGATPAEIVIYHRDHSAEAKAAQADLEAARAIWAEREKQNDG